MYYLTNDLWFPDPSEADDDGLLAVGGDLSAPRLLLAYHSGIFPWYSEGQPLLWWSPAQRMVLEPGRFKVSKSLRKTIASGKFRITYNTVFSEVMEQCAAIKRNGQDGTWITSEMEQAYLELHQAGHAHSVEVWRNEDLVGGLYGIDLPEQKVFCGESMFSKESDASKVGFYYLADHLKHQQYHLIDCQLYTAHLASLGAEELPRADFLMYIRR